MSEKYVESKALNLKTNKTYDEKWVQGRIFDNPDILNITQGLSVVNVERRQFNGGRLDLLLEDENEVRYTVEIQLGATDEAHIIRTIEYWDNERSRNPNMEHVAVIVAEDITTRFLNVISLFNKSIPLIAVQLKAYIVGEHITVVGTKVLDLRHTVGEDVKTSSQPADRNFWEKKTSPKALKFVDDIIKIVRDEFPEENIELNYTKPYIGMSVNGISDNFIVFNPKRNDFVAVHFNKIQPDEETEGFLQGIEEQPFFDKITRHGGHSLKFSQQDLETNREVILKMIHLSAKNSRIG